MVLWWPPVNLQSPPVPRGLTDGSVESSGRISARSRSSGSSSLGTGPSIPNCMRVTLPPKNVSLAEWFNASKENGNDEDSADALPAGIQGGSASGTWRPEHRSGGQDAGRGGADAVQLGQGGSPGQAYRRWQRGRE